MVRSLNLSLETEAPVASLIPIRGVDRMTIDVSGRFEVASLPKEIKPLFAYDVEYEFQPDHVLKGNLTLTTNVSSRLGVEQYLGFPFQGQLTIDPSN